jgi:hypothetical protein
MSVTFENGVSYDLLLEPYSKSPCNFIGTLKDHPSTAAVTGCLNNPEDKMHITLISDLNTKSAMYEMDFNGRLKALENPFKYQRESSHVSPAKPLLVRDDLSGGEVLDDDKMGDEEKDPAWEELELELTSSTAPAVTWPSSVYAYVKFGYEQTFKAQMDSEGTDFATYVDSVMTHVQSYYKHDTLPTQVLFKYDTAETIYKDVSWPSTDSLDDAAAASEEDNDYAVNMYAWFGKDTAYYGTVGLAYLGGTCTYTQRASFNEWRNTPVETAMVVAHEMGHNLGMSHDFDDKHGGDDSACNGQGIMSYGDAPSQWSDCSVSDFAGYYEMKDWGSECLASWDDACFDNCDVQADCPLSAPICADAAGYGGCDGGNKAYFDDFCKKTCLICPSSSDSSSSSTDSSSSSTTTTTTTDASCTDSWGDDCSWVSCSWGGNYCKKSCGVC